MKKTKKGRIGLYTVGHPHYWDQFEGLQDRLLEYASFIEKKCHSGVKYIIMVWLIQKKGLKQQGNGLIQKM